MSKSLENFVLARDVSDSHQASVVRFFMLSVHYRNPINFTDQLLAGAKNSYDRIKTAYTNLAHRKESSLDLAGNDEHWLEKSAGFKKDFEAAMNDDFNTANAISVLFVVTIVANLYFESMQSSKKVHQYLQEDF